LVFVQLLKKRQGEIFHPPSPLFISHSPRNQGERISYDGIRKVVEAIRKETGLDLHAHQFRHTFATDLVLKGMNPYHVMTLTRHKSVQSFRRYTKAADQAAAKAAFYGTIHKGDPNRSRTQPQSPP
jgi:integrase/recombinase XerD